MQVAEAEGWFRPTPPFEKAVYLTHGAAHCVLLTRNGRPDTFLKFSELANLAGEADRSAEGGRAFPGLAPTFVGYASQPGLDVLATRAAEFRPLTVRRVLARGDSRGFRDGLETYLRRMQEAGPSPAGHAWFEGMRAYFERKPAQDVVTRGLRELEQALPQLPALPQHGDLVLNNLGLRPDRGLVVFDWEDYGAVCLPGLDLFTLEASLQQEMALYALPDSAGLARRSMDLPRMCRALGLAPERWESLRTGCALAFRYLKRNYSAEVRARADALVDASAGGAR